MGGFGLYRYRYVAASVWRVADPSPSTSASRADIRVRVGTL